MIQRRAQCIDIRSRLGVTEFGIILFRRRVLRRAQTAYSRRRFRTGRIEDFDQAKINEEYLTVGSDADVGGLYIAMHQAMPVNIFQGR